MLKNHCDDLLNFWAIYEAQNADDARTLVIWFGDKLREVYAQTISSLSGDSSDCS